MATRNWADYDEDDDDAMDDKTHGQGFLTKPDKDGIMTQIGYCERDGKTYKVIKRIKQHVTTSWTNQNIQARKSMEKFGKVKDMSAENEKKLKGDEEVPIELSRSVAAQVNVKDEAEDKFHEESLQIAETMTQQKKAWTASRREEPEEVGVEAPKEAETGPKRVEMSGIATEQRADAPKSTYLPPTLRNKGAGGAEGTADGKGKGKGMQNEEISLRITNLSDDAREGDLWDLFGSVGRLARIHLAKDQTTGLSRGFAFASYYNKEDAEKAIAKLNGHGYDNLILQVSYAKPRT